jgi:hypothetical protein
VVPVNDYQTFKADLEKIAFASKERIFLEKNEKPEKAQESNSDSNNIASATIETGNQNDPESSTSGGQE